jgi:hypothetical protein
MGDEKQKMREAQEEAERQRRVGVSGTQARASDGSETEEAVPQEEDATVQPDDPANVSTQTVDGSPTNQPDEQEAPPEE